MSEQENIRIVQQAYSSFKTGDIESLLGLFSDNIVWQLPNIENVPIGGKRSGLKQVGQFFASVAELEESLEFEPRDFVAQGNKVAVQGQYRWRVRATGREYQSDWAHVFTVENGKVTEFQEYLDTAVLVAAFQKAANA